MSKAKLKLSKKLNHFLFCNKLVFKDRHYLGLMIVIFSAFLALHITLMSYTLSLGHGMHEKASLLSTLIMVFVAFLSSYVVVLSLYVKNKTPQTCSTGVLAHTNAATAGWLTGLFGTVVASLSCISCSLSVFLAVGASFFPVLSFLVKYKNLIIAFSIGLLAYLAWYYFSKVPEYYCESRMNNSEKKDVS